MLSTTSCEEACDIRRPYGRLGYGCQRAILQTKESVTHRLGDAKGRNGATVFDRLVGIVACHGKGGRSRRRRANSSVVCNSVILPEKYERWQS